MKVNDKDRLLKMWVNGDCDHDDKDDLIDLLLDEIYYLTGKGIETSLEKGE